MNPSTPGPSNADIEVGLRDLGTHLEVGSAALVDAVLARLANGDRSTDRRFDPRRLRLLAAAILVVTLTGLAVVPPTRQALADWLGVGGVRIIRTDQPPPTGPPDRRPPQSTLPPTAVDDAAASLSFDVRRADPGRAGPPLAVAAEPRVATGLLEIRYRAFTLVQLASAPGEPPALDKFVDEGTSVRPVTVDGQDGFWISGEPHEIGFVGRDGRLDADSVRRAGNVLVWEDAGVTYRIEGLDHLDAALAQAGALR